MRAMHFLAAVAIAITPLAVTPVLAAEATAAAAKPAYTTADTDLGTLLDNPASKAVLAKYIPAMISNPQIDMARSMTLESIKKLGVARLIR